MLIDKYVRDTNQALILKMTENSFFKDCEQGRRDIARLESRIKHVESMLIQLKFNGDSESKEVH